MLRKIAIVALVAPGILAGCTGAQQEVKKPDPVVVAPPPPPKEKTMDEVFAEGVAAFDADTAALSDFDQRLAQALADIATIAILQQRALARSSNLAEQLQLALNTRITVEQAKGVIAEFGGVDMGAAFEALRSYSRGQQTKLSAVAHSLVTRELGPERVIPQRTDR